MFEKAIISTILIITNLERVDVFEVLVSYKFVENSFQNFVNLCVLKNGLVIWITEHFYYYIFTVTI